MVEEMEEKDRASILDSKQTFNSRKISSGKILRGSRLVRLAPFNGNTCKTQWYSVDIFRNIAFNLRKNCDGNAATVRIPRREISTAREQRDNRGEAAAVVKPLLLLFDLHSHPRWHYCPVAAV